MGVIKILEEEVSNIIAAGEVVESPSSLIKELLENSIDAGSKCVTIEVKDSGRYIKILDDGTGMEKDDLLMCIERHATSKIKEKNDIFNLKTYGFRGEALSSICAVGKVKIASKKENMEIGNVITISGSKVTSIKDFSMNKGTEIEVKELFFNTPARLKFLRKENTEFSHIKDIVFQEALANPEISITLILNGKMTIGTSGNGIKNAIVEIFGRNTLKNLLEFQMGFLGNSTISRATKDSIYIFVNGRIVKSKIIEDAVIDGYYTRLSKGKYPFALIFLEIEGKDVDVNVHPSKKIVKFSNDINVYNQVVTKIREFFLGDDTLTVRELKVEILENNHLNGDEIDKTIFVKNEKIHEEIIKETPLKIEKKPLNNKVENLEQFSLKETILDDRKNLNKEKINLYEKKDNKELFLKREEKKPNLNYTDFKEIKKEVMEEITEKKQTKRDYRIIGQFLNSYIIVERDSNLELYDQHVVHERILYEEYKENYLSQKIKSQHLLIPQRIIVEPNVLNKINENLKILESFGFEIEEFGKGEILLRAIPIFAMKESIEDFFRELIKGFDDYGCKDPRESIIITMSCKGAIKAGEPLKEDEMKILIDKLHDVGEYTCPHGRPIILRLGKDEIEKKFKRK